MVSHQRFHTRRIKRTVAKGNKATGRKARIVQWY